MNPRRPPRLEPFLAESDDRRRWHRNVAQGSHATADVYVRRLAAFCRLMKVTPEGLARMGDKPLRDLVMDFVDLESRAKHAGSYIHSTVKAVNSWRKHCGRAVVTGVNIRGRESTPTLVDEVAPSPGQVRAVLAKAPLRNRVVCGLMAYSGVRPEVLGNYLGDDGLTLGDFPELELGGDEPRFRKVPALVVVRESISKAVQSRFLRPSRSRLSRFEPARNATGAVDIDVAGQSTWRCEVRNRPAHGGDSLFLRLGSRATGPAAVED